MTAITEKTEREVLDTIRRYALITEGDRVIVGLSGGADSMCLTHILCALSDRLGIEVAAAHMNHNIRGSAADSDAEAARQLAKSLGIEFYYKSEQVIEYAKRNSLSEELAGRELRYKFFAELQCEHGFNRIATAHNKNDNAETLVMNFMRGSTIAGLCGIPPVRGTVIRPLIETDRADIESYCTENNLPYVTDSTNLEAVYTRNKVRLELIPQIQRSFNSNFINTVTANARLIAEENSYIAGEARRIYEAFSDKIYAGGIAELHPALARRVIINILSDRIGSMTDISSKVIEDVFDLCKKSVTGKKINLPQGFRAEVKYGELVIDKPKKETSEFSYSLEHGIELYIAELDMYVSMELCRERQRRSDNAIYLSCDDISSVKIRNRRNGDIFYPVGMNGRKKLKEFFIDRKIPSEQRMKLPIIEIGGDIAAVSDLRTDKRYIFGKNKINFKIIIHK